MHIQRAIVVVKAWHSSRFTPAILRSGTKVFDFLKKDVLNKVNEYFDLEEMDLGKNDVVFKKILVIPSLPSGEPHRSESITLLEEQGIDGIISFATILESLIKSIEINHSYQKSDLLQLIRILKIYDMIKEPQMTFFD
jgi:NADH/NAD ratio-sensing transcriptional regulator Rex